MDYVQFTYRLQSQSLIKPKPLNRYKPKVTNLMFIVLAVKNKNKRRKKVLKKTLKTYSNKEHQN